MLIAVSDVVILGVGMDTLTGLGINVMIVERIDLELNIELSVVPEVFIDVLAGTVIVGTPDSDELTASGCSAVMFVLEFAIS